MIKYLEIGRLSGWTQGNVITRVFIKEKKSKVRKRRWDNGTRSCVMHFEDGGRGCEPRNAGGP